MRNGSLAVGQHGRHNGQSGNDEGGEAPGPFRDVLTSQGVIAQSSRFALALILALLPSLVQAAPRWPATPSAPYPSSGASDVSLTPTLTCSAERGTAYELYLATSSTLPTTPTQQNSACAFAVSLNPSTLYFWKVVARNSRGSVSGSTWTFTTVAPTVSTTGRFDLTWTASITPNVTAYEIDYGTAPRSYTGAIQVGGAALSGTVGSLPLNQTYFLAVRAYNGLWSDYSTEVSGVAK